MAKLKEKISEYIANEFSAVYCETCEFDLYSEWCEGCHRKYMNWRVSIKEADKVADRIIDLINQEDE